MSGRRAVHGLPPSPARSPKHVRQPGFTYMGVLIMVAVTGIALAGASQYWSTIVQREREAELLYRGDQIRRAIATYYAAGLSGDQPQYPRSVEDLLRDPRYPGIRRHLRKPYADPMHPGGEWQWVRDGTGRIKGVYSQSPLPPLKKTGFDLEYREFQKAKTYADWRFVFNPG
jgi:type II secretory pathway pseudopilin PulG